MQMFVETIIYLIAIMGIIVSTISIFDIFFYKGICRKRDSLYTKNWAGTGKVTLTIKFENITLDKKREIVHRIENGEYENIQDLVDSVDIIM